MCVCVSLLSWRSEMSEREKVWYISLVCSMFFTRVIICITSEHLYGDNYDEHRVYNTIQ